MQIELVKVRLEELAHDYRDDREGGVVGYSGRLDIRPPYQREFVYKDKQRAAVIDTVLKGFPLNVMYWAVRADGTYEIIDGQQRTISICQYINGDFSFENLFIHNLQSDQRQKILDYELTVYLCSGTDSEKLDLTISRRLVKRPADFREQFEQDLQFYKQEIWARLWSEVAEKIPAINRPIIEATQTQDAMLYYFRYWLRTVGCRLDRGPIRPEIVSSGDKGSLFVVQLLHH